jgi:superfamily II DNA or RNA helicase
MLDLRPYQDEAIEAIETAYREGVVRPLTVHPTGTGKTVTFAHLIKRRADLGRSLTLVHREELAGQTVEKLAMIAPELETGVVQGDNNQMTAQNVVASVWTLVNRLDDLKATEVLFGPFTTIVVDEAHHAPAPTWRKILTAMGSFSPVGPLTAGFTATPQRDKTALDVWERVVAYMSIREAIYGTGKRKGREAHSGGYLVPIEGQTIKTSLDLGKVRKTGGDYGDGSLGDELEESGAILEIADGIVEHAADRKGVAFTPTVATAHSLARALRARGITAEALDGTTPKDLRKGMLKRLRSGETRWVVNCGVLTEGFDEPSISCVCVARPTKFQGLYIQMVGRGTRLHPGKKNLLILDVTGASERHELTSYVDLGLTDTPTKRKKDKDEERSPQVCPVCQTACTEPEHRCALCQRRLPATLIREGALRHETCVASDTRKVDVFQSSRLRWLPVGDAWCLGAGQEVVVMVPVGDDTWKLATYQNAKVKVLHTELPADWAMGIGEDRAKAFQKLVERDARWLSQPVSDSQKGRLVREGLPEAALPRVRTRGEAADLITRIAGRHAVRKLASA